jgi:phosphate transport system substrate-binding protein
MQLARQSGIEYVELPICFDAITIAVNPQNTWVDDITTEDLKKIWQPAAQGKVTRWNQIRSEWPNAKIALFGAGSDSGTFDYFTEAIVGKAKSSRGDYTASEDDNVLVQGIANDPLALGFFGVAYYEHNKDRLKLVAIDDENPKNGDGPILPEFDNVKNSTYQPLSRPIFIYVNKKALDRAEISEFVKFYLSAGRPLVKEVGYIPLPDEVYDLALKRTETRVVGSVFGGKGSQVGVTLQSLLSAEKQ